MAHRTQATSMGIEDFLGHKTSGGGGGRGAFLDNWKKRKRPLVDVWLHCHARITAVWSHPWPKIQERDVDGVKTREVWSDKWNSWEPEEVLRRQRYVDKTTGERDLPPTICPMSLMLERVRQLVAAGELSIAEKMFRFEGDDTAKGKVLHAGGMIGAFDAKKLSDDDKAMLKKTRIYLKDAWQENMLAKCNYLMQVVDNDAIDKGVRLTIESSLLGDKIKSLIAARREAKGPEKGNPLITPWCIRWKNLPDEEQFDKKYDALCMEDIEPTEELLALIQDKATLHDTTKQLESGNITELRTSMETHYVGPEGLLDWDEIFGPAEAELANEDPVVGAAQEQGSNGKRPPVGQAKAAAAKVVVESMTAAAKPKGRTKAAPPPEDDEDEDTAADDAEDDEPEALKNANGEEVDAQGNLLYTCDTEGCAGRMRADQDVCPVCKRNYGAPAPEPKAEPKRRSAAAPPPPQADAKPKGRRANF